MGQDGKPKPPGDARDGSGIERRRSGPRKQKSFVERATAQGHSGYGLESVRPHLRDQLKLKALMQPSFLPPQPEARGKDEHHQ